MKTLTMRAIENESGQEVRDSDRLMKAAGLNPGMGFEGIGLQDDGTPIVFDRCGGFGYLDGNLYAISIEFR